jgi:hypothetical protein
MDDYSDEFPTCAETFTTFRIFSKIVSPSEISRRLNTESSKLHTLGDRIGRSLRTRQEHAWFLCSRAHVASRDTRRHLDWILDRLEPSLSELRSLQADGAEMDVVAYWVSKSGQGGPVISSRQMERLARFGVECWWDVYFNPQRTPG